MQLGEKFYPEFSSLLFTVTSTNRSYPPPPPLMSKSGLKLGLYCKHCIWKPQSLRTLKIMPRNLNEIVRSWIRLQENHVHCTEPVFVNLLRRPGIDSQLAGRYDNSNWRTSYQPARLRGLAESIPWNRCLGSLNVYKFGLCVLARCCFHGASRCVSSLAYTPPPPTYLPLPPTRSAAVRKWRNAPSSLPFPQNMQGQAKTENTGECM
jgi:hypothetical protein